MKNEITIKIFDFDGTIFNSPVPNRDIWNKHMFGKLMSETERGGYGWFQNPITLAPQYIGNSDFNEDVLEEIRIANENPNEVTVMLTGRTVAYSTHVRDILDTVGIEFDHYGLKPLSNGKNKIFTMNFKQEFIRDIISKYDNVVSVQMWDDRSKHVDRFNDFLDSLGLNGGVHYIKEDERKMDVDLERELVDILKQDAASNTKESNRKAIYYGAFLYPESHFELLEAVKDKIPKDWVIYAHHMTLLFGKKKNEEVEAYLKSNMGKDVNFGAVELGISDDAMAVKIDSDVPTDNEIPHVTIAVTKGGKPFKSNFITNWTPLEVPVRLKAKINAYYG